MTEKITDKIVNAFIKNSLIGIEEREEYAYTILCIIESAITIGSLLVVGAFFREFPGTCVFCVFFFALRKRTSGFHMATFFQCYVGSILILAAVIYLSGFLSKHNVLAWTLFLLSAIIIAIIRTVNHPNMNMSEQELSSSKKSALTILLLEILSILFLEWLQIAQGIVIYAMMGVIACAVLLLLSKVLGQEKQI